MYLYIHIPFCKSKCAYCDFFSIVPTEKIPGSDKQYVNTAYISAVLREAEYRKKKHAITQWDTIYIGGGTPGLLTMPQITQLFAGLYELCPTKKHAEITIEVNPADITQTMGAEYLAGLSQVGVNRISCGIQCLHNEALQAVGRRASADEGKNALNILHSWRQLHNRGNTAQFSVDMIAGLPKLSDEDFMTGLKQVLDYTPDHISLYSLMIEEGTALCRAIENGNMQFDEDNVDSQWIAGRDFLLQNGYTQYEVSNFAKIETNYCHESIHNAAYWQSADYVGLGAGACGTVKNLRVTGTHDIDKYCEFWNHQKDMCDPPEDITLQEYITEDERIHEFLMMGFRTSRGIDAGEFLKRFHVSVEQKIGSVFGKWEKRALAHRKGDFYALTAEGLLFLNRFLQEII